MKLAGASALAYVANPDASHPPKTMRLRLHKRYGIKVLRISTA
jgi:hypothetical protein